MTVIVFIVILATLVLIHEFGHFIAAKKSGVKVEEFGLGFPPRVWGKKIGETLYSINLLPIGGFVKVYGEEYHEDGGDMPKTDRNHAFVYQHPIKKLAILFAGVIMNFLLGWVLISYLFTQGVPTPVDKVIIEQITPNSPAANAGLQLNDVIVSMSNDSTVEDSELVTKPDDLVRLAKLYGDVQVNMVIARNGQRSEVQIVPRKNPPANQGALGIVITNYVEKKYPWYSAPYYGLRHAVVVTTTIIKELGKTIGALVTFQDTKVDVTGPVGIAQYTGQAIKFGSNAVLELTALLSLNLAVVNLLPFPALDGGRIMFVLYEWISRRRIPAKFEQYLNLFGIITLLTLSVVITYFDILKLLK